MFAILLVLIISTSYPIQNEFQDNIYYYTCVEMKQQIDDLTIPACISYFETNPDITAEEFLSIHDEKLAKDLNDKIDEILSKEEYK